MRIAILSDSHDNMEALSRALEKIRSAGADLVLHLGDIVSPFTAQLLPSLNLPIRAVYGNNDGERSGLAGLLDITDPPRTLTLGGKRFRLYHAPHFSRQPLPSCDYYLFGHTHAQEDRRVGGVRLINPGEAGGWLTGTCSFALLDTTPDRLEFVQFARKGD